MILRFFATHIRVTLFLVAIPFFAHPQPSFSSSSSEPASDLLRPQPHPSLLLPLARESDFFKFTLQRDILLHSLNSQGHTPWLDFDEWSFEFVQPLAPWLSFDTATRTFSGTPTSTDIGFHNVHLRVLKSTSALSSSFPDTVSMDVMNLPFLVASASGVDAPPEIIQTLPISWQISQQRQHHKQQELEVRLEKEHEQEQGQEQEQEQQEQTHQQLQQLHMQRRVDKGGQAIANEATPTKKGEIPSIFEPYADAEVWEGQANPLRIQLDPQTFVVTASSTAAAARTSDVVSSAGPITYYVKTDISTTLPSWLKFDTSTLEFSGTPPIGTYKRTTILTVTIAASSVPGYTQATDRFTIKIHVHSLGLSTFPMRSCSAFNLYYSQEWDRAWQSYLPDLVLEHQQRQVNYQIGADLFRVDGCSQPARTAAAAAALSVPALNSNVSIHNTTTNDESSSTKSLPFLYRAPYITRINMALSTETTQELSQFNNTLPSWLSFDPTNWTLTGDLPQGAPSRIILDVEVADSFNTSAVFKLQIFSETTPFSFLRTIPDIWVKRGELFNVDLLPPSLLSYPAEATVLPVEHKFLFEPIDMTQSQTNASPSSPNTTITKLGKNPTNPLLNSSGIHTSSSCSYADLWGQQSENNREAGPSPLIPNWFNRTSFTSNLPSAPTPTSSVEEGKIELQGHIPCELILRVRWLVRNSLGQLASTEFMIWANDQGPPQVAKPHADEPTNLHHSSIGPIGVKIAVGIAVATPVLIAIWFMIARYCKRLRRQDGSIKPTGGDLEGGRIRPLSGSDENGGSGLDVRSQRRRQPTTEILPNGEPEYRSSYEDDPSVGHHDSYSEKYVAEHGPYLYTTTSGDEGEGSGSSKRTSILGWIFGDRYLGEEELAAAAAEAEMNRRRMSEPLTFSLKRISVGYPFDSNRFGFVDGNRLSLYDSGAGTTTDASSPSRPTQQNNTIEFGQVVSDAKPSSEPPSESAPRKLSNRSSSIFKKSSKRLSKLMKDKDAINDHVTKRDATAAARQLGVDSAYQTVRPCHSFLSTGTGYMASMSECNTSIDEQQDSGRNSHEEMEEDRQVDRSNADKGSQKPWTPSTFLLRPQGLRPNRDVEFVGGIEGDEPEYRGLSEGIHRSDSGALMTGSSSMAFSELAKDTSRNTKTPPSIKTSFLDLGRASSAPPHLLPSWTSNLQVPGIESDRESTVSLSSTRTAPVTGSEVLFTKERQSSVHAGPGSFRRRSIVEFLQSNDEPISPLSAFSASLPSLSQIAESSALGKGKGTLRGSVSSSQEESSANDENRDSIYSIGQEGPHETTKWMVVPSNQTFRSVSVRKNTDKDQKEMSEWISDPACDSEMVRDTGKSVDRNRDEYDQRHRSLPYEIGTVKPSPLSPTQASIEGSQLAHGTPVESPSVSSLKDASLVTTHMVPISPPPRSAPAAHSHSLSNGFTHMSSVHSQLPLTRHSMDRMRPVSYPLLAAAPVANAVIPRRFVKATIGTAFHSTSSIRDPMSSSPSSPRMMAQHTSLSRAMSPPPMMSPPLLPSSPPPISPRSSIFFGDASAPPLPGEYRAYLVSDPNDVAQAQEQQQQQRGGHHHRPSASLSSIDVERADLAARPRRKLPEWIQFNNKMRSLWGRPIPGTAGEWQVSMVQTQLVPFSATATTPTTPTTPTPSVALSSFSSAVASAGGSVVTVEQHPTLGQQDVKQQALATEAGTSLKSAVEGKSLQISETTIVQGEVQQTQDVEVELVVLLVREPGEAPLSPLLGATRSRTFPSLTQAQDQAQLQQVQQLPPVSSSSLSMKPSEKTAPSLATPDSPPASFTNQGEIQGTKTTTVATPAVVETVARIKESAKPSPVSPLSGGASVFVTDTPSSSASPPCLQQQQEQQQQRERQQQSRLPLHMNKAVSTTTSSAASSPGQSPPHSSSGGSSSGGPGRAVGQRVLAERRRIEAMMMKNQQGL